MLKLHFEKESIVSKIYNLDQHVQLIEKSSEILKFMLNQNSVNVEQIGGLMKMIQRGNPDLKVCLTKLLKDISRALEPYTGLILECLK